MIDTIMQTIGHVAAVLVFFGFLGVAIHAVTGLVQVAKGELGFDDVTTSLPMAYMNAHILVMALVAGGLGGGKDVGDTLAGFVDTPLNHIINGIMLAAIPAAALYTPQY